MKRIGYVFLVIVSFLVGLSVGKNNFQSDNSGIANQLRSIQTRNTYGLPEPVKVDLVNEVWNQIHQKYVGKIDDSKLSDGILRGLISGLEDPFSAYANKDETKQFNEELSGKFSGVGIEIGKKNNLIVVIAPLKNSPAARAGIRAGDYIIAVDGKTIGSEESVSDIASKIRGPIGTNVDLKLIREKHDGTIEITITRENIELESVTSEIKDGVGIINLSVFHEDTAKRIDKIAKEFKDKKVKGIVIDMRNNPGGLLQSAVQIAGHFIKRGDIVVTERAANPANENKNYSEGPGDLENVPTVVLLNGGSASASEILAGALRDNRGIKIIGEKSFGKGSVQEMVKLSDGSSLRITIAKWYMPKGGEIAEKGIEPDIKVTDPDYSDDIDVQMDKAITVLKTQLNNP